MAFSKEELLKLLNNPAMVNASDLEDQPEQAPEKEEIPDLNQEDTEAEPELHASSPDSKATDSQKAPDEEVLAAIKKLRNKQNGIEDEEPSADVASDTSAPMEMRKKAIQQIKQKYLGTK